MAKSNHAGYRLSVPTKIPSRLINWIHLMKGKKYWSQVYFQPQSNLSNEYISKQAKATDEVYKIIPLIVPKPRFEWLDQKYNQHSFKAIPFINYHWRQQNGYQLKMIGSLYLLVHLHILPFIFVDSHYSFPRISHFLKTPVFHFFILFKTITMLLIILLDLNSNSFQHIKLIHFFSQI